MDAKQINKTALIKYNNRVFKISLDALFDLMLAGDLSGFIGNPQVEIKDKAQLNEAEREFEYFNQFDLVRSDLSIIH